MKRWLIPALLILIAVLAIIVWKISHQATPTTIVDGPPPVYPKIIGSWFVHYSTDPYAKLDVTIDDQTGSGIASAVAELTGPSQVYREIKLSHKPWETEWKNEFGTECTFLPETLDGGIWWISRVKVVANDGSWSEYYADDPYGAFRHDFHTTDGAGGKDQESNAWIGALYVTETDSPHPLIYINTFPSEEGKKVDMIMRIYRAGDTRRWIAINDEPDAMNFFPRIAIPLIPGEQVYIHLNGRESKPGPYSIVISDTGFQTGDSQATPSQPDAYEIDDTSDQAKQIALGEIQRRTIVSNDGTSGDEDWLLFTVPKK